IMQLRIVIDLLWKGIENKACIIDGYPQEIANHLRQISGLLRSIDKKHQCTYFKEFQRSIGTLCHEILTRNASPLYTAEYAKKFKLLNAEKASFKVVSTIKQLSLVTWYKL